MTLLSDLAHLVDGELHGDGGVPITDASTIRDAEDGHITFVSDPKIGQQLAASNASAVVTTPEFQPEGMPYITVENVSESFAVIVQHFRPQRTAATIGISAAAHIASTAKIGRNVTIYPGAYIGDDVVIGDNTVIHPGVCIQPGSRIGKDVEIFANCVLYEHTVVGDRCVLHAGVVLGAYGFGYETRSGRHIRSAQLGNVVLEADVELGAGTTIDRGTYNSTVVCEGTKIDNLVQIAHNCRIGRHNILCSQVGIAGSSSSGDYVLMAGQVGIKDHVHIGDQAILGAKTGIKDDVPPQTRMFGIPATPEREQMVKQAALSKLPEMRKQLKRLMKQVDELQQRVDDRDAA